MVMIRKKKRKELLGKHPYFVGIKEDDKNYVSFIYSNKSNFKNPVVRECRGIILYFINSSLSSSSLEIVPVCVPFFKFGNFHERYVPEIDWPSAKVTEKLDGSIMKLWFHNSEWHISFNACITPGLPNPTIPRTSFTAGV
jgi:hypothetical protein